MLIISSGCYVAYSWGANDVANCIGVIVGAGILTPQVSIILGGLAIVFGIVTWGYKVIETIGSQITHLLPIMAFSAQLANAIIKPCSTNRTGSGGHIDGKTEDRCSVRNAGLNNVHIYTVFGIPVSTSHSIVGAIFGVGLVKGMRVLNLRIAREIVICWLTTPFISGVISFLVLKGMRLFVAR
jgi:PiT family inorganic phosphate transporter